MVHSFLGGLGSAAAAAAATGTTLPETPEIIRFVPVGACMLTVFDKVSVFDLLLLLSIFSPISNSIFWSEIISFFAVFCSEESSEEKKGNITIE
jgi:hypothetical protein